MQKSSPLIQGLVISTFEIHVNNTINKIDVISIHGNLQNKETSRPSF